MTAKYLFLISYLIISAFDLKGQYFNKTFGLPASDETGSSIIQMNNGIIYLAGFSDAHGDFDFTLQKLDQNGNVLWEKFFGTDQDELLSRMIKCSKEPAFVMIGSTISPSNQTVDGLIIKVDTSGNIIWQDTLGVDNKSESFTGITETFDGGYAVSGDVSDSLTNGFDFLIAKWDSIGIFKWQKTYGTLANEVSANIVEDPSKNLIVAGDKELRSLLYNVHLLKTDSAGNMIWEKEVEYPLNSGCKNITKTPRGHYIISGESIQANNGAFDAFIIRIDLNGDSLWTLQIGGNNAEHAFDATETPDGNYLVTGFGFNPDNNSTDILLLEIDSSGKETKRVFYGDTTLESGISIINAISGGYLISGYDVEGFDNQYMLVHDKFTLISSIAEKKENEFSFYPNPTRDIIQWHKSILDPQIIITDINGILVYRSSESGLASMHKIDQPLKEGTYIITCINESVQINGKVVIIR